MAKVAIAADSTHCLPADIVSQYDIRVSPVGMTINGVSYRDTDLTNEEFWKLFHAADGKSTSSGASIGDFVDIFTALSESTDSVACIVVSKGVSGSYDFAVQAREIVVQNHPDLSIKIVDSRTSGGALGFIVLEAARAAQSGKTLEEVVGTAEDMVNRVKFLLGLDTLRYLIRGGRAPKVGYVGELLQLKPIIGFVSGSGVVDSLGKVRGKHKCMLKLVEMLREYADTSKPVNLMVHYTDGVAHGEELRDMITSQIECGEVYLTPLTPVMCSHTGPVIAISFYS